MLTESNHSQVVLVGLLSLARSPNVCDDEGRVQILSHGLAHALTQWVDDVLAKGWQRLAVPHVCIARSSD